jgi:hypothetical protein
VSKEDIEAEKARLAAIDARPIKKVAEAKARKQKRLQVGTHCPLCTVQVSIAGTGCWEMRLLLPVHCQLGKCAGNDAVGCCVFVRH